MPKQTIRITAHGELAEPSSFDELRTSGFREYSILGLNLVFCPLRG